MVNFLEHIGKKTILARVPGQTGHSDRALRSVRFFFHFFFQVLVPSVFPSLFLLIRVVTSYNFRVLSVAWSPDEKQIASGSVDETIKIWDSQSGDC